MVENLKKSGNLLKVPIIPTPIDNNCFFLSFFQSVGYLSLSFFLHIRACVCKCRIILIFNMIFLLIIL